MTTQRHTDRELCRNAPLPYGGGLFGSPWTAGELWTALSSDLLAMSVPPIRVEIPPGRQEGGGGPVVSAGFKTDPLIGILLGLGHSKAEARAWAAQVTEGTPEERWEIILGKKQAMLTEQRRMKAGLAPTATLRALVRQGYEKTAGDVAREQGISREQIEDELGQIRAYAEGATDLGTGSLIVDHDGEVTRRIGSGLPTWLQDLGGPKAILEALERRAGKLYDDLLALAIEQVREPVPF